MTITLTKRINCLIVFSNQNHYLMTIPQNISLSGKNSSGQDSPFSDSDPHQSPYERFFPPYQPGPSISPVIKPSPLRNGSSGQDSPFIYPDPHRSPYERFFPPYQPVPNIPSALRPAPSDSKHRRQQSPFIDPDPHRSLYEKYFPPYQPGPTLPPSLRPPQPKKFPRRSSAIAIRLSLSISPFEI